MTYEEALETTLIHSAAGELGEDCGLMAQRPFRTPHHNVSVPAMIGGGGRRGRARYHWRTMAFCFSTSCPNSGVKRLRRCVNRWRTGL